jgi:predicted nucleic acid-binding Zn ribbon protein
VWVSACVSEKSQKRIVEQRKMRAGRSSRRNRGETYQRNRDIERVGNGGDPSDASVPNIISVAGQTRTALLRVRGQDIVGGGNKILRKWRC